MITPEISIIVPTYCEAENLRLLVPAIHQALGDIGPGVEIIIVDDDSPDDTEAVCAGLIDSDYPVRLHVRQDEARALQCSGRWNGYC